MKSVPNVLSTGIASYDAIVVGSGFAGLAASAILSRKGLKTLIVDDADQIGGRLANTNYNGYWLEWGLRDARDTWADNFIALSKGQYGLKVGEAAGIDIPWVGPITPNVLVHRESDGEVVPWNGDPEAMINFGNKIMGLSQEQAIAFLTILGTLAASDPNPLMNVTMKDWLADNVKDPALVEAFDRIAWITFALPINETSAGRWAYFFQNPLQNYLINDPEVGGIQGMMEEFARATKTYGGEIKLGLKPIEISVKVGKVTGVVTLDKTSIVHEFRAPIVIFTDPCWDVFDVLDKSYFPSDVMENAPKIKKAFSTDRGNTIGLEMGLSRVPTIRATGKPDQYIGFEQLSEHPGGWHIGTLASEKMAPPGKHLLSAVAFRLGRFASFEEAKAEMDIVIKEMHRYYSDLDDITEWMAYRWYSIWPTSSYWMATPRFPSQIDGLDGLYFAGQTVEADGVYQDAEACSVLQTTDLILQRHKMRT